jgi:hypothetical protein
VNLGQGDEAITDQSGSGTIIQFSVEYCPLRFSRAKIVDVPPFIGIIKSVAVVVNSVLNL